MKQESEVVANAGAILVKDAKKSARKRDFLSNKAVGQSSTSCSSPSSLQEELGCWDGWMDGWMDGWGDGWGL